MAKENKEVSILKAALEKCKDRNSSEARAIRRKLRVLGEYVSGGPKEKKEVKATKVSKKEAKVKKVKKVSKKKAVADDEEDD